MVLQLFRWYDKVENHWNQDANGWIYFPANKFIDNKPKCRALQRSVYIRVLLWLSSIVQLAGHWMPYVQPGSPVISKPSTILSTTSTAFPRLGTVCRFFNREWEPLPILCLLNVFNRVIAADITNWTMKEMAEERDLRTDHQQDTKISLAGSSNYSKSVFISIRTAEARLSRIEFGIGNMFRLIRHRQLLFLIIDYFCRFL